MEQVTTISHPGYSRENHSDHRPSRNFANAISRSTSNESAPEAVLIADHEELDRSLPPKKGTSAVDDFQSLVLVNDEVMRAMARPVGHIEGLDDARIYGVHLLASHYLSELAESDSSTTRALENRRPSTDQEGVQAATAPTECISQGTNINESSRGGSLLMSLPVTKPAVENEEITQGPAICDEFVAGMAYEQKWLERSIRFTQHPVGQFTAWLRDYRPGERNVSKIIGEILTQARNEGIVLKRIMLNGHEVWNSTEA